MKTNQVTNDIPEKQGWFKSLVLRNKFSVFLLIVLIIVISWGLIKIQMLNNSFSKEKTEIVQNYELKIDSISINRMQLTAKIFTWAVRGELMRENEEQINQYFLDFIKMPQITKLQCIRSADSIIFLSTDKKDEGQIASPELVQINEQTTQSDSTSFRIATPIMGLTNKLGVFVMEVKK